MSGWLKSFIESLERLLDKPPYLIFVFIATIFVVISLITRYNFKETWIFFLYSVVGTILRYIERDFLRPLEKYQNSKLVIISIYHLANLGLLFALLKYLNII